MVEVEIPAMDALVKYLLLPVLGFVAGFLSQWFLQHHKTRDELVTALAPQRAHALCALWAITTLAPAVTSLDDGSTVPAELRESADRAIVDWYTNQSGALFLSWPATNRLFRLLDTLRDDRASKANLESAVSSLRSTLKHDCGFYSYSQVRRRLARPRHSPWAPHP